MKKRLSIVLFLIVALTTTAFVPVADAAVTVPVVSSGLNTFTGTFTIQKFAVATIDNVQKIVAIGTLTGVLNGQNVVIRNVQIPITGIDVTGNNDACEILHLELGPIDLNLLGLVVHLDKVVLDITAQPGPGNLLGNLLCAIAGLLDNININLQQLVGLLNNVLRLFR